MVSTFSHLSRFATRLYDTTAAVFVLKAGLWSGDLVLHHLRVRTDVSRKLHLPIVLKQGSVELVRLQARARFGVYPVGCDRNVPSLDFVLEESS